MSAERFLRSKTRRADRRSLAELSERPLRGGLPVLRCCPFARFRIRSVAKEDQTAAPTLHRLCPRAAVFMVWGENPERWSVLRWLSGLEDPRSKRTR
jgi:hypothetical protein